MADRIIVFWRDIPAQIIVKAGRRTAKRELPERFVQAIDRCAMKVGAKDTDAYLAEWRRGTPQACGDDLEAEAESAFREFEETYTSVHLKRLIDNGGWAEN